MSLLLAMVLSARPPAAVEPASGDTARPWRWQAGLAYGAEVFRRDRSTWQTWVGSLGYRFPRVTLLVDLQATSRFNQWDQALGTEAYFSASHRWSGYALAQVAPGAGVLPRSDLSAALDRGIGDGWELGASYRRMAFATATIDIVGIEVNKYHRDWYFQVRGSLVPKSERTGFAGSVRARRAFGSAGDLVEFSLAGGEEVVLLGPSIAPDVRGTASASARLQQELGPRWGLSLGVTWNREARVPDRYGVALGLQLRW